MGPSVTSHPPREADLLVIGGGVMGRFTAYHASALGRRVTVLERGRVGDPTTASYGRTRSFRNDYLDATYARLAFEALRLWTAFEAQTSSEVLVRCGCLNLAKAAVTPDLEQTYAQRSHAMLERLGMRAQAFDTPALRERFPYLDVDLARLDPDAGVVDVRAADRALDAALAAHGVAVHEGVDTRSVAREEDGSWRVATDAGEFYAGAIVVTAGHGTNDVLARLPGCELRVPITRDRPSEAKYFTPPAHSRESFTSAHMPVVAYLDTGIYCHPIVDGVVEEVKIGYYNPPDIPKDTTSIAGIHDFVEQCMPGLREAAVRDVDDVDGCDYDLVADDDFVLGAIPGAPGAFVGVGWRGTGYKFAPWVGRVLAELALQDGTIYDLDRFDPARFDERTLRDAPPVTQDLRAAAV